MTETQKETFLPDIESRISAMKDSEIRSCFLILSRCAADDLRRGDHNQADNIESVIRAFYGKSFSEFTLKP